VEVSGSLTYINKQQRVNIMYLIEMDNPQSGVEIIPTISRKFTSRDGEHSYVNLDAIMSSGFDGAVRLNGIGWNYPRLFAFGMEDCVQVKKQWKWQKVTVTANVPVKSYCLNGWFKSLKLWLRFNLNLTY
jgi:hypothetical protein